MQLRRLVLIALALLAAGCGRSSATYNQAVANAVKSEPDVVAFERLYPGSFHFISYYTGTNGTPTWNSKALIHGRYILTMQFRISIDSTGTQVTATALPGLRLVEVSSVTTTPNGQTSISYHGSSQRQFGLEEWEALQASGGDLTSIGIQVKIGQPVAGLRSHWRAG